ncbi:class I SAM-dependent methyltransferase [Mumia zhuanghuii]|uniref:Class I SAM-dependent methyltransferase n=1 Tax=Mumia zhuanghuii TaxID=2585211 RepID=A0A5C4LUY1_9ACTN|nr:class I SAM-dependent methyltransferase [Mumia zhuanghuii]TNC22017.1 class I SAM-dependent methyltransferase [Mumia zhuanghuii]
MSVDAATVYDRFMGRFAEPLADEFVRLGDVRAGQRVLDVGCGPGALTARLAPVTGEDTLAAVDPSPAFVAAVRSRLPRVDVRRAAAESLPYPDDHFDAVLAQLVVNFMTDPVAGLREMRRVAAPGARVAACVWDHGGGTGPFSTFWTAVHDVAPTALDDSGPAETPEGHLLALFDEAGFAEPERSTLTVTASFPTFEDWWEPFTLGLGTAGAYVAGLDHNAVTRLRARCRDLLPAPPFDVPATAWAVRARA